MKKLFKLKHSFNAGDLITVLPGLQKLYDETLKQSIIYQRLNLPAFYYDGAQHPTVDGNGNQVCMNDSMWGKLMPLLTAQPYIWACKEWEGEDVDFNIDNTRLDKSIPMPYGNIHQWPSAVYPELDADLSVRWIHADRYKYINTDRGMVEAKDAIIVNRTSRYQNPYISYSFLKKYGGRVVFSGTKQERDIFCQTFSLDLPLISEKNFLELASMIKSCKLYIGNQSFGWHLADGLKAQRILELSPIIPHVFPTGANGSAFYRQENLEYYVEKYA